MSDAVPPSSVTTQTETDKPVSDSSDTSTTTPAVSDSSDSVNTAFVEPADLKAQSSGNAYQEQVASDDPESVDYNGPATEIEREFVYASHLDPARQRDPNGIYLDDLQRREAEVLRAKVENREPDLDNPPAICGTPLVPVQTAKSNLPADAVIPEGIKYPVSVGTDVTEDQDLVHQERANENEPEQPVDENESEKTE